MYLGLRPIVTPHRFAVHLNHFMPDFLLYSVAVFLKWQSDLSLGAPRALPEPVGGVAVPIVEERPPLTCRGVPLERLIEKPTLIVKRCERSVFNDPF